MKPKPNHSLPLFQTVALIGVGLIGGSFALEAKRLGQVGWVVGYDQDPSHAQQALELGIIDEVPLDWNSRLADVDLVVLAMPVGAISTVMSQLLPFLSPEVIITDVGSVKGPIMALMQEKPYQHLCFIGGHPIAGSEKFGPQNARIGLFQTKKFVMTPGPSASEDAVDKIRSLWEALGSEIHQMDVDLHDGIFAEVSHLPHLLAYACMEAYAASGLESHLFYSGAGLKDFSRISASSPAMWSDIFLQNKQYLLPILHTFQEKLSQLEQAIQRDDASFKRTSASC